MISNIKVVCNSDIHTGKCIRRLGGIYAYCGYFIDRKWYKLVLLLYRKTCHMPKGLQTSIILSIQYEHGDLCKH